MSTIDGIGKSFVNGAATAGGAMAMRKAVETAEKVDHYNVANNPPPKDREGKILTDADGKQKIPFSPIESTLIYGGIAAAATVAPVAGAVAAVGGTALYGSRVIQNNEDDCKIS